MRENLTELVFILDRSGSMTGLESDTIGGFNAMIEKQQKEAGEVFVSTVLFDDEAEVWESNKIGRQTTTAMELVQHLITVLLMKL